MKSVHFEASDIHEAWLVAAKHLLKVKTEIGMSVTISDPLAEVGNKVSRLNPKAIVASEKSLSDVANTIFPKETAAWGEVEPFFDRYARAYERLLKSSSGWGCYYQRLTSFGDSNDNQVKNIIDAMNRWGGGHRGTCTLHLSSPELDRFKKMGNPCRQFGEFLREDDGSLTLLCVYRSHDYFSKALGNFVGLVRLLKFVAMHTNSQVGRIICISSYANFSSTKEQLKQLVALDGN